MPVPDTIAPSWSTDYKYNELQMEPRSVERSVNENFGHKRDSVSIPLTAGDLAQLSRALGRKVIASESDPLYPAEPTGLTAVIHSGGRGFDIQFPESSDGELSVKVIVGDGIAKRSEGFEDRGGGFHADVTASVPLEQDQIDGALRVLAQRYAEIEGLPGADEAVDRFEMPASQFVVLASKLTDRHLKIGFKSLVADLGRAMADWDPSQSPLVQAHGEDGYAKMGRLARRPAYQDKLRDRQVRFDALIEDGRDPESLNAAREAALAAYDDAVASGDPFLTEPLSSPEDEQFAAYLLSQRDPSSLDDCDRAQLKFLLRDAEGTLKQDDDSMRKSMEIFLRGYY